MGSLGPDSDSSEKEIHVLVTGFGEFGENKTNPSFFIAQSLPNTLARSNLPPIIIHAHSTPIVVAYSYVRDLIPKLLFSHDGTRALSSDAQAVHVSRHPLSEAPRDYPNYDLVLNIGMAPGRSFYTLETLAHRDGYTRADTKNQTLDHDTFWRDIYGAPEILHTTFDTEDVWRRWKCSLMSEDLRPSSNAGHYLCDFTYYASMLEYWRRDNEKRRPCMFLHVPGGYGEDDVLKGKEVALGLIAACVESEVARDTGQKAMGGEKAVAHDFGDEGLS